MATFTATQKVTGVDVSSWKTPSGVRWVVSLVVSLYQQTQSAARQYWS